MELHNIYNGKTVLVTGASGLIGSNLVDRLMQFEGITVIVMGRNAKKLNTVFSKYKDLNNFHVVEHDINEPISSTIGNVDFLFHAASPISGEIIEEEPVSVITTNLCGTLNCLEYLKKQNGTSKNKGTLIIFSSATVYGKTKEDDETVCESQTQIADNLEHSNAPYTESKRMIEVIARAYNKQYNIAVKIARFSYIYGFTPIPPNTAFYNFISKASQGEDLIFLNSGFARRDNIYIDDAINGLLYVCEYGKNGEPYNVSSNGEGGNYAAIDEMANAIVKVANNGIKVIIKPYDRRFGGIRLDNSKLKSFGWSIQTSLVDGVYNVYKRYLN